MFSKILVANRGEIAVRILRTCREMGITSVAVFSEVDRHSLHVMLADESVCIGGAPVKESYLNIPVIIKAAQMSRADAIHPGYGLLSENGAFAEACRSKGIRFIGPSAETIYQMGDKHNARVLVKKAGVPVVPGSDGPVETHKELFETARALGFPLIMKARGGGGGRGLRIVRHRDSLAGDFEAARSEALACCGSQEVFVEKYIEKSRHIEVQILADRFGTALHLGERECSIQRRHQKLIEETPSPCLDGTLRKKLVTAAVQVASDLGYENAGTMEFVLDGEGNFYFLEMNTRIQVEHPVTEMVTGLDLVREQIEIAAGKRLKGLQKEIQCNGHAIECRINAENPDNNFMPSPGQVDLYIPPGGPGVRVDSHIYQGYLVSPYYDSLVAKLVVHARDRHDAIARMRRSLEEFIITGIKTTIPFHMKMVRDARFQKGDYHSEFLGEELTALPAEPPVTWSDIPSDHRGDAHYL